MPLKLHVALSSSLSVRVLATFYQINARAYRIPKAINIPKMIKTTPEAMRTHLKGMTLPSPSPTRAPISEVIHSAAVPPRKMAIGALYLDVRATSESWVLSPNSISATTRSEVRSGLFVVLSLSSSFSGLKESRPNIMNTAAARYLITVSGTYSAMIAPTVTASALRITKASAAPMNTGTNPYLADRVSMAIWVAILTLSARYGFVPVFIGAALAFVILNALAVTVGAIIAEYVPETVIRYLAAAVFIIFGLLSFRPEKEEESELSLIHISEPTRL